MLQAPPPSLTDHHQASKYMPKIQVWMQVENEIVKLGISQINNIQLTHQISLQ